MPEPGSVLAGMFVAPSSFVSIGVFGTPAPPTTAVPSPYVAPPPGRPGCRLWQPCQAKCTSSNVQHRPPTTLTGGTLVVGRFEVG